MKKNKNHIDIHTHLSKNELVDYTNGILGNEEMYRLELHLNECALCSDAIEGVALMDNSKEVLDEITSKILPTQGKKGAPNYMAIAASIALIAVVSLSYWLISKPSVTETIAVNTPVELEEESKPLIAQEEPITTKETDTISEDVINESVETEDKINVISPPETQPTVASTTPQKSTIKAQEIEPAEPVVALNDATQEEDVAINDEFALNNEVVSGSESEIALSETVQSAPSRSRVSKKSSKTESNILKDQKEPSPTNSMAGLKSYIEQNIKYPQEAIDNNIKGTVVLEVSVNTDGSINNITVIKGLGYGCDAEAMRLISSGPAWTPKVENGKAVKASREVKIKFKKQ